MRVVSKDEIEGIFSLSESDLVSRAAQHLDSKRYVVKKAYFINRYVDLACHLLNAHPTSVLSSASEMDPIKAAYGKVALDDLMLWLVNEAFGQACTATDKVPTRDGLSPLKQDISKESNIEIFGGDNELCSAILSRANEIFPDRGESIVSGALQAFGRADLSDWVSRDLFSSHLSKYSNSRRQAPIYWPLQNRSESYTLWISYHALDEQTLYTCVNDYIDPELRNMEKQLNDLRRNSSRNSREEKRLTLLSESEINLKDFRDELLRLAKFWVPNLNDGVQISAAPLWKLFQHKAWQKKLKETWEKMEKGEYDWAHLACSIWPERVFRKCHQDRSLAIAHDVEATFWHEVEVPVKRGKKTTGETKKEWQPKNFTDDELNALIQAKVMEKKA